jgi:hypothetical protein
LAIGDIGIGYILTLATFTTMDAGEIAAIKVRILRLKD